MCISKRQRSAPHENRERETRRERRHESRRKRQRSGGRDTQTTVRRADQRSLAFFFLALFLDLASGFDYNFSLAKQHAANYWLFVCILFQFLQFCFATTNSAISKPQFVLFIEVVSFPKFPMRKFFREECDA